MCYTCLEIMGMTCRSKCPALLRMEDYTCFCISSCCHGDVTFTEPTQITADIYLANTKNVDIECIGVTFPCRNLYCSNRNKTDPVALRCSSHIIELG